MYAEVAVPYPVRKTFHYRVPPSLHPCLGGRVLVSFARKWVAGYVVAFCDSVEMDAAQVKEITEVLDPEPLLLAEQLCLARWVAEYYLAPLGEVLKAMLPPHLSFSSQTDVRLTDSGRRVQGAGSAEKALAILRQASVLPLASLAKRMQVRSAHAVVEQLQQQGWVEVEQRIRRPRSEARKQKFVRLASAAPDGVSPKQGQVLQVFRPRPSERLPLRAVLSEAHVTAAVVKGMIEKGILALEEEPLHRRPFPGVEFVKRTIHELTREQEAALAAILEGVRKREFVSFLLHGVTGSGKTEIYIRAIAEVVALGRTALMLVPEIALTPALSQLFRACFGEGVAILHSNLTAGQRLEEWWRIRRGAARVVIGTRSAVFAPLQDLGMIIVDEEHDGSYKQDNVPFYHGREAALFRARSTGATVVLGSATPSLESYFRARYGGSPRLLSLESRVLSRPLAEVEVVDMRDEVQKYGPAALFSRKLRIEIRQRLDRREQVLVLLNRRGYASSLLCRKCGAVVQCPHCSIALTYHQEDEKLLCHYCGMVRQVPSTCEACQAEFMHCVGAGTEKVEAMLKKLYPGARVDRLDRDTTRRQGSLVEILAKFSRGETDILVGTQMIAKGHDIHNVTLVGVLSADIGLGMPDFRSAERTFQLLTQVAGRAGRGEIAGKVVIQTYYPNHYALRLACQQDYPEFFRQELQFRESLRYPPFTTLANLLIRGPRLEKVLRIAHRARRALDEAVAEANPGGLFRVLGPAPAPLEKLRDEFRYQILLKSADGICLHQVLEKALNRFAAMKLGTRHITVDVDSLLLM